MSRVHHLIAARLDRCLRFGRRQVAPCERPGGVSLCTGSGHINYAALTSLPGGRGDIGVLDGGDPTDKPPDFHFTAATAAGFHSPLSASSFGQ